jgi:transcriptional regulator of acetoin/glycerol metabolism
VIHRFLINNTIELTGSILSKNRPSKISSTNEKSGTFGLGEEINQKKKEMILEVLNCNKWHIRKSAEALGISLRTMQRRMNQYNLKK